MSESWGIKVALPGKDVTTATPEECAVHSGFDTFKINRHPTPAHYGAITVSITSNPASGSTFTLLDIAHGYSYRPALFSHIRYVQGGRTAIDSFFPFTPFGSGIAVFTTDTRLKIVLQKVSGDNADYSNRTYTIRYYIAAENGN